MKKLIPSCLMAIMFLSQGMALASPTTLWEKTFGGPSEDNFQMVRQTTDGGYIAVGTTESYGAGDDDVYLVKTDLNGNEVWDKTFGGSSKDTCTCVQQTSDGGYIISGYFNWEQDACLIKTDSDGNPAPGWPKFYSCGGDGVDIAYHVQQTSDGGYIFVGITNSCGAGDLDIYLVKTDSNGNEVWHNTFGGNDKEHGYWVQQTTDGGYIVVGDTRSFGATGQDVYLIKTDSNGSEMWHKIFGGSGDDWGHCVQQTKDGGYIVCGITNYQSGSDAGYLIKTDSNGNNIWEHTFGGISCFTHSMEVQQTCDDGYIVAGYTNCFGAGNLDAYLIKTDSNGKKVWDKTFGGPLVDGFTSVQQTSDGGYITAGLTAHSGAGTGDAYLVKINPLNILAPNGGEQWVAGTQQTIRWQTCSNVNISKVKIEWSSNDGNSWVSEANSTPNTGSYQWTVPQVTSNKCLVRISDANDSNIFDTSDNTFIIFECRLNSKADLDGNCKVDMTDFALFANDWLRNGNPFDEGYTEPLPIIWVYINDPGVSGHEGFTGYMSKYETTNTQYCQFLNAAFASGDITVDGNNVLGASGSNSGEDFVDQVYYNLAEPGWTGDGATNGGAARINYNGGVFSVDSGFENHPVTNVSWYGATAFCSYYGYRLPTEWEWQAVADYDGSYTYGCGTSINNSMANLLNSTHPDGTTAVGAFGTYGYGMCDLDGNVFEWTSSIYSGSSYVLRGGGWRDAPLTVSYRDDRPQGYSDINRGFRACR